MINFFKDSILIASLNMASKEGAAVDSIWEHREVRFDILVS